MSTCPAPAARTNASSPPHPLVRIGDRYGYIQTIYHTWFTPSHEHIVLSEESDTESTYTIISHPSKTIGRRELVEVPSAWT